MRPWATIWVAILLCGCPARDNGSSIPASQKPGAAEHIGTTPDSAAAWLVPEAKINSAVRLTSPAGIDLRQAAYWQPQGSDGQNATLQVLLRTRDYNKREEGVPDPQRVAVLDLLSGETKKLDENLKGLPTKIVVSPNHQFAVVSFLEPLAEDKGYSLQAVDLRAYGFAEKPVELRPQPAVEPYTILDNGNVLCRIVRGIVIVNGQPAVGYDWLSGTQLCNVADKSFSGLSEPALAAPVGNLQGGYSVSYDPALPDRARITYWLGDGGRGTQRWEMPYYAGSAPFDWAPPVRWLGNDIYSTIAYRKGALGDGAGLFRIVAFESDGEARLIEDRATPDVSIVAVGNALLYALRSGRASWSFWAVSADGLEKQRVRVFGDTVFLEVLDEVNGRRILVHRQLFGEDGKLRSELLEMSLDPLQATKGEPEPEEINPLPGPRAIVEEAAPSAPLEQEQSENPPDDLFPSDPGDGGFIPDLPPGDGPPPISG